MIASLESQNKSLDHEIQRLHENHKQEKLRIKEDYESKSDALHLEIIKLKADLNDLN